MKTPIKLILATVALHLAMSAAPASAADTQSKAVYNSTNEKAAADYKQARAQCDSITGNPKDVCVAQAKAARVQTEANATAAYKGTPAARASARDDIANANYDVESAKCGSQTGTQKDVCIKQAKANQVAAKSDATADKKATQAWNDANEDKLTANYKVAKEKCDAFAGQRKDDCVTAAKNQYGK